MWKYIDKDQCNEFLLFLHLIDCKCNNEYLEKLYTISNRIENNYKVYKIRKRNGKYRTIYNQILHLNIYRDKYLIIY